MAEQPQKTPSAAAAAPAAPAPAASAALAAEGEAGSGVGGKGGERRGIPIAPFVTNVQELVGEREPDLVLKGLDDRLQQYKLVELKMLSQKRELQSKIPEIKKCLDIVQRLLQQQEAEQREVAVDFEVAEGIFAAAKLQSPKCVCLWLGANVMLQYSLDEALALLTRQLDNAKSSLSAIDSDIHFVRDQMNTTEVTIARVHNWGVQQRRR